jgi:hypothetical protein
MKDYKIGDTVYFEDINSLVIEDIFDFNGVTYLKGGGKTILLSDVLDENSPYVIFKKRNKK